MAGGPAGHVNRGRIKERLVRYGAPAGTERGSRVWCVRSRRLHALVPWRRLRSLASLAAPVRLVRSGRVLSKDTCKPANEGHGSSRCES